MYIKNKKGCLIASKTVSISTRTKTVATHVTIALKNICTNPNGCQLLRTLIPIVLTFYVDDGFFHGTAVQKASGSIRTRTD